MKIWVPKYDIYYENNKKEIVYTKNDINSFKEKKNNFEKEFFEKMNEPLEEIPNEEDNDEDSDDDEERIREARMEDE